MTAEKWRDARTSYSEALKLFQEEYPKQQLALIAKDPGQQNASAAEAAEKKNGKNTMV